MEILRYGQNFRSEPERCWIPLIGTISGHGVTKTGSWIGGLGVEQWGLQDHQHRECLKISLRPILPAIGFHHHHESNHYSHRRSFQWAIRLTSLHPREAIESESKHSPMALDMAKKEHGSTSTQTQSWQ